MQNGHHDLTPATVGAQEGSWPATATDLVIATLAASEAELTDEVRELAADAHIYRELAQEAVHALARGTLDLKRAQATIISQRDEIRALRAELERYASNAALGRAA